MRTHAELLEIYNAPGNTCQQFRVTQFERSTTKNQHNFTINVLDSPEIRGHPKPRKFMNFNDTTIGQHPSRTTNWDSLVQQNRLHWIPLQGKNCRGRFYLGGGITCDDGGAQTSEMPPPAEPEREM